MKTIFNDLLKNVGIYPVLVDVGASGQTPSIWDEISQQSIYIGFDPDQRELSEVRGSKFYRSFLINKALTDIKDKGQIPFYLTKYPYCSSALKPNLESLSNYLFVDLFTVEREATLPSITLDDALQLLSLSEIHWFKTDSQGTDLRLIKSIADHIRSHILAVDIEPGLIDAYFDEDLFIDAHRYLNKNGFWLSNLVVKGAVRMRNTTLAEITSMDKKIDKSQFSQLIRKSPAWCEARYFRTLEYLTQNDFGKDDYLLLWIFAMIDNQLGFALDVAVEYEKKLGKDKLSSLMKNEPLSSIIKDSSKSKKNMALLTLLKSVVPPKIRQLLRRFIY